MADTPKLLIIGGSSFIGRNLLEALPPDWSVRASYCHDGSFQEFVASRPRVEAFELDLTQRELPYLGNAEVVLYLPTCTPGQASGVPSLASTMYRLHAEGVSRIVDSLGECDRFIYFSSGIAHARHDYSDYRKSKLLGEANVQAYGTEGRFGWLIIRSMESYGPYLAAHKLYRRIAEACVRGDPELAISGDGQNLIDTLYIDDYVAVLVRLLESDARDLTVPVSSGRPVTVATLVETAADVFGPRDLRIRWGGQPTENTRFILDNSKMLYLTGHQPRVDLREGLRRWLERDLI